MRRRLPLMLAILSLLTGCYQEPPPAEEYEIPPWYNEEDTSETPSISPADRLLPTTFALPYQQDQSLDPILCETETQTNITSLLFEPLFTLDETFTPQPVLCAFWEHNEDWTVWTLRIRENIPFSDGSVLTASDVVATLLRARDSQRYGYRLRQVASIRADGAQQVIITLTTPNNAFLSLLDIPIVKAGSEKAPVPVGTGPYLYVTGDNGKAWLSRNDAWRFSNSLPLSRIDLIHAKDRDVAVTLFSSRQVQLCSADLTGTQVISLTGSILCTDVPTTVFHYLGFNTNHGLLSNAAVRKALSLGVQQSQITQGILSGHAEPTQHPISPSAPIYPHTLERDYRYESYTDALLAAGIGADESEHMLSLLVNAENSFKVAAAQHIAEALSALNLTVDLRVLPWEEYTTALAADDFDLYYGETRLTADWDLTQLVSTGGSLNFGGYSNALTNELVAALATADDRTKAAEQLCRHLMEAAPILPICFKNYSLLTHTEVVPELSPSPSNVFHDLNNWTIHLRPAAAS